MNVRFTIYNFGYNGMIKSDEVNCTQGANYTADAFSATDYYPFGMQMPGRNFNSSEYRFGFNGKEKDDEWNGVTGATYDYGFRIYDSRIARFLSVDPLTSKFPMLTPYQFSSNTPIWAVDLDGLEARIYSDLSALPHSFISVVDDNDVLNVYTYGQYGQKGTGPAGYGALVHLKGSDAQDYIDYEFKKYGDNMKAFEVSDKLVDKQKIIDYYAEEMKKGGGVVEKVEKHAPTFVNKENGSSSVLYKFYFILPNDISNENCSSVATDALKAGGFDLKKLPALPWVINAFLEKLNEIIPNEVKDVTNEASDVKNETTTE